MLFEPHCPIHVLPHPQSRLDRQYDDEHPAGTIPAKETDRDDDAAASEDYAKFPPRKDGLHRSEVHKWRSLPSKQANDQKLLDQDWLP